MLSRRMRFSPLFVGLCAVLVACGSDRKTQTEETSGGTTSPRTTLQNGNAPMRPADPVDAVDPEDTNTPPPATPTDPGSGTPTNPSNGTAVKTTLRVHYPSTQNMQLRGSDAPLSWTQSMTGVSSGDTVTFEFDAPSGTTVELKPVIEQNGQPTWSVGANFKIAAGATKDIYPYFYNYKGKVIELFDQFVSHTLPANRDVLAYLPPSYDENTTATYPVLYMHDGQNLFDPSTAFGGTEWKVDETLDQGINDGTIGEVIVIAINNTKNRMSEYTPTVDSTYGGGGGDDYLTFITSELMPEVKNSLRVRQGPESTGIMGSSLGGLISAYAGVQYPGVFGRLGIVSPSTWWDKTFIINYVKNNTGATRPTKVYVDSGDDDASNTAKLAATYQGLGYVEGDTLHYVMKKGQSHNEYYWSLRLPEALGFLFPER